jgi:hypothetical protein
MSSRGEDRFGILPIGFYDGFARFIKKPEVLVCGKRLPVVGTICMDQVVINLHKCPEAKVGDEAIIIGRQGTRPFRSGISPTSWIRSQPRRWLFSDPGSESVRRGAAVKKLIGRLMEESRRNIPSGRVADYIPELAKRTATRFSVSIATMDGAIAHCGDTGEMFTMQSVSKLFSLALALESIGPKAVFSRVGMNPTSEPFNSILKLEISDSHKPMNPMINAGAIAVVSILPFDTSGENFAWSWTLSGEWPRIRRSISTRMSISAKN